MIYTQPTLHNMNSQDISTGDCVNGSGAAYNDTACVTGPDVGFVNCGPGSGASKLCMGGGAASNSNSSYCSAGTGVTTACGTGSTPAD